MIHARQLRAVLLLIALGCGNSGSNGASPSHGGDASMENGDGSGVSDAPVVTVEASGPADAGCSATPPSCFAAAPTEGLPCDTPSGFYCEYGDDPQSSCNTLAKCREQVGGWIVDGPFGNGACPMALPPSCPASAMAARTSQTACPAGGLQCIYPEATCDCGRNGAGPTFECSPAPSPGCPATRPRYGTPCGGDAGPCMQWGDGCGGLAAESAVCTCGTWQPPPCPLP